MASNLGSQSSDDSPLDAGLNEHNEWLRVTLSSIGDAVVTVDSRTNVTFLNKAAQSWTGWSQAEGAGSPLHTVVQIIDEANRMPVEKIEIDGSPVPRLDERIFRTLLIARDGTERPIDWSTAPILDDSSVIAGNVLILRDCTERRRGERATEEALSYAAEIMTTLREPFLVLDKDLRVVSANASFLQTFQVSHDRTIGRFLHELGDGQWNIPALRSLLEETIPTPIPVQDFEVEHRFPEIGLRNMVLNARRFPPDGGHSSLVLLAIQEITERKKKEAELHHSELRFRRLFQTAKDGILILEADNGTIIEANPFMCGLLGYEVSEFLGKQLWEIGLFEDKDANREAYELLRDEGYIRYEHLPLRTKSGGEVEVEFVSNLYTVGNRRVAQCNIRDITQRCRMEREAKAQATALADLHRRKDEFLAMLSHELRNPLSPILNAVHLLRLEGNENLIQREARDIIERQVGQLSHIVDDLLEVTRFTSGKVRLQPVRLEMGGVVERAVASVRPLISRCRHTLELELSDKPIWLNADPARLEQVVVNLLNNAAKYTDEGGRIWLKLYTDSHEMVLSVRDSGIGIDLKQFPEIFDLFTQASRSLDRAQGGLGIGLSLVKRLVEMHRGSVDVLSEGLGRGSEFIVRLPLSTTLEPEAPPKIVGSVKARGQGGRIMVVDDNVDSAEVLAKLLRRSGYDVRTAYTGPDALMVAADLRPDVILLDIGLPGLNGYEVARRLRQDPSLKQVKLIAMTGYGQESDVELALEAGFDKHLVKPVNFSNVQEILTTMLAPSAPNAEQ